MSQQVFFVDSSVADSEALKSALELSIGEGSKVFVLESNSDAFKQMDEALASLGDVSVDAVHIYAHGTEGSVSLGGKTIDEAALSESAAILDKIGGYLTQNADILLYSCSTAKGAAGQSFVQRLAALTRADVAASTDLTGATGNWVLEEVTGQIETTPVVPQGYTGTLDDPDARNVWALYESEQEEKQVVSGSPASSKYFITNDDTVAGGAGNDIYYVERHLDDNNNLVDSKPEISEAAYKGNDTVVSRVKNFELTAGSHVENIILEEPAYAEGEAHLRYQSALGNTLSQSIKGNALDNVLMGGATSSSVAGDSLDAGDGDDYLDGGMGLSDSATTLTVNTTMVGGKGNDTYVMRNKGDVITEAAGAGDDTVLSYVDVTLGANVEHLTLLDGADTLSSARMGVGNALGNEIHGNQFANTLDGGAGDDTLYGSEAGDEYADSLSGGAGNDAFYVFNSLDSIDGGAGTDSLYTNVDGYDMSATNAKKEALVKGVEHAFLLDNATELTGNKENNWLHGNATLASTLVGNGGTNTLTGGTADDLFIQGSANDLIQGGGGKDAVYSLYNINLARATGTVSSAYLADSLSYNEETHESKVVSLNTTATAQADVATTLVGNSGNNKLTGGGKDDMLVSYAGKDTLAGGAGDDTYVLANGIQDAGYELASNEATITEAANAGDEDTVLTDLKAVSLAANVENLVLYGAHEEDRATVTGNALTNVISVGAEASGYRYLMPVYNGAYIESYQLEHGELEAFGGMVEIHGGKNGAGVAGDTLIGATAGLTFVHTYNKNDVISLSGDENAVSIDYYVAGAEKFTKEDWQAYFSARGMTFDENVAYVYRGDPTATSGDAAKQVYTIEATDVWATNLLGTARNDTLKASQDSTNSLGTTLDGGAGADLMVGSNKGDTFYVDNVKDTVDGGSNEADEFDEILSSVSVDLGGRSTAFNAKDGGDAFFANAAKPVNINNGIVVSLIGNAAVSAAGKSGEGVINELIGNNASNTLVGGSGTGSDDDKLAYNTLDGGAGADMLVGGQSNSKDVFIIDNAGDKVVGADSMDAILSRGVTINLSSANHSAGVVRSAGVADDVADTVGVSITGYYKAATKTEAAVTHAETLKGGIGADTLNGMGGKDQLLGGAGDDVIYYHGAETMLSGGYVEEGQAIDAGVDTLVVTADVTDGRVLRGIDDDPESVADTILTTFEGVTLEKGAKAHVDFSDVALEENDGFTIIGNEQATSLIGGVGDDYIATGGGVDSVLAGDGADTIQLTSTASAAVYSAGVVDGGKGDDLLDFGTGADKAVFTEQDGAFNIDLSKGIKDVFATVKASNIEEYNGGAGNDTLDATALKQGVTLSGGAGTNMLYGGAGSDTFVLRDGTDTIWTDGNSADATYQATNNAKDVIRLTEHAIGKTFVVKDFDVLLDTVDNTGFTEAEGWDLDRKQSGANAVFTWTKAIDGVKKSVTITFQDCAESQITLTPLIPLYEENGDFSEEDQGVRVLLIGSENYVDGSVYADQLTSQHSAEGLNSLYGNAGDDTLTGEDGDLLDGGEGNDLLIGNGKLYGGRQNTHDGAELTVNTGNDTMVVSSLQGTTEVNTGDGNNEVRIMGVAADQDQAASIHGGAGVTTLVLGSEAELDLADDPSLTMGENSIGLDFGDDAEAMLDNLTVVGSSGADTITANADHALNYVTGGGKDQVTGSSADDTVTVTTLMDGMGIGLGAADSVETIRIEAVKAGPATGAEGVTLSTEGDLELAFEKAVKLDLSGATATIEMGGQKLTGVTLVSQNLHVSGSKEADTVKANGNVAFAYTTNGGADSVTGSSDEDVFVVNGDIVSGLNIDGMGGEDRFSIQGKIADANANVTLKSGTNGDATADFAGLVAEGRVSLDITGVTASTQTGATKAVVEADGKKLTIASATGVKTWNADGKKADFVLSNAGDHVLSEINTGESTFTIMSVADNMEAKTLTITAAVGDQETDKLILGSAAKLDLTEDAEILTMGDNSVKLDLTGIDSIVGSSGADSVKAGTDPLVYATNGGADSVIGSAGADSITVSTLVDKLSVDGNGGGDEISVNAVANGAAATIKGGEATLSMADATGDVTLTLDSASVTEPELARRHSLKIGSATATVETDSLTFLGAVAQNTTFEVGKLLDNTFETVSVTGMADPEIDGKTTTVSFANAGKAQQVDVTLTGNGTGTVSFDSLGANGNSHEFSMENVTDLKGTTAADAFLLNDMQGSLGITGNGGADSVSVNGFEDESKLTLNGIAALGFEDADGVEFVLNADNTGTVTDTDGTMSVAVDSSLVSLQGTAAADTFAIENLNRNLVIDGNGSADTFQINAVTAGKTLSLKSAENGTLSFEEADADVTLSFDDATAAKVTATVGTAKSGAITLDHVNTFVGAEKANNTFVVNKLTQHGTVLSFEGYAPEEDEDVKDTVSFAGATSAAKLLWTGGTNAGEATLQNVFTGTLQDPVTWAEFHLTDVDALTGTGKAGDEVDLVALRDDLEINGLNAGKVRLINTAAASAENAKTLTVKATASSVLALHDTLEGNGATITLGETKDGVLAGTVSYLDGGDEGHNLNLALTKVDQFKATDFDDVFMVTALADNLTLDGRRGGNDVFTLTGIAVTKKTLTLAASGESEIVLGAKTLSFDGAESGVTLTLPANATQAAANATVKMDGKDATLALGGSGVRAVVGTGHDDVFTASLGSAIFAHDDDLPDMTLYGGDGVDTLNLGSDKNAVRFSLQNPDGDVSNVLLTQGTGASARIANVNNVEVFTVSGNGAHAVDFSEAQSGGIFTFASDNKTLTVGLNGSDTTAALTGFANVIGAEEQANIFNARATVTSGKGLQATFTGGEAADAYNLYKTNAVSISDTNTTVADTITLFGFQSSDKAVAVKKTNDVYQLTGLTFAYNNDTGTLTVKNGSTTYLTFNGWEENAAFAGAASDMLAFSGDATDPEKSLLGCSVDLKSVAEAMADGASSTSLRFDKDNANNFTVHAA